MSTYSDLSNQLDEIIQKLQDGSEDIDIAIEYYKQAQKIIIQMEKYLKEAELTIKKLKVSFSE